MGVGLKLYALEYGSVTGSIQYRFKCWFRNAGGMSWLILELKAGESKLVPSGLVFWLVC